MKRRIDLDEMQEVSLSPDLALVHGENGPEVDEYSVAPVLRNEWLWNELIVARQQVCELEKAVRAACVKEPLDDVELALAKQMWRLIYRESEQTLGSEDDRYHDLREKLRKHMENAT